MGKRRQKKQEPKKQEEKEYRCSCAVHCKLPGGKKVGKSTYYAHAIYRKSLSPIPGGLRIPDFNDLQGEVMPGQAPPIADILEGYPHLGTRNEVGILYAKWYLTQTFDFSLFNSFMALHQLKLKLSTR